jgi:hypothetical protein
VKKIVFERSKKNEATEVILTIFGDSTHLHIGKNGDYKCLFIEKSSSNRVSTAFQVGSVL